MEDISYSEAQRQSNESWKFLIDYSKKEERKYPSSSDIVSENETGEKIEPPSVSINEIDSLKTLTSSKEIQIAGGDLESRVKSDENSNIFLKEKEGRYFRDIIFALVQIRLPEDEARSDWAEILKHKYTMCKRLGRNVGIHVATLDYYINIKRRVFNPKILDAHEYADTASRAITDELTRTYNRGFFDEELKRLFTYSKRFKKNFSLLMIDLDHFKIYNDNNGHIKGDIVLIQAVNVFHAVCGGNAAVCRYGGEEFAVLIPDCNLKEAVETAENLRRAIYDYRFVNEQILPGERLSVSCGVTVYRKDMTDSSEVLEEADIALYRAKNSGRNRVKTFLKQGTDGITNR